MNVVYRTGYISGDGVYASTEPAGDIILSVDTQAIVISEQVVSVDLVTGLLVNTAAIVLTQNDVGIIFDVAGDVAVDTAAIVLTAGTITIIATAPYGTGAKTWVMRHRGASYTQSHRGTNFQARK